MSTIFDETTHKMCYLPLTIHKICMTDVSFEEFKCTIEKEKENINVELYDQGNCIQILVQYPEIATFEKFKLLIDNGAKIESSGNYLEDIFSYISSAEFHVNYIPILDYLFENNFFDENHSYLIGSGISNVSCIDEIESGVAYQLVRRDEIVDTVEANTKIIHYDYSREKEENENMTISPILLLSKHKEYIPILKKHLDKLTRTYNITDIISTDKYIEYQTQNC